MTHLSGVGKFVESRAQAARVGGMVEPLPALPLQAMGDKEAPLHPSKVSSLTTQCHSCQVQHHTVQHRSLLLDTQRLTTLRMWTSST